MAKLKPGRTSKTIRKFKFTQGETPSERRRVGLLAQLQKRIGGKKRISRFPAIGQVSKLRSLRKKGKI